MLGCSSGCENSFSFKLVRLVADVLYFTCRTSVLAWFFWASSVDYVSAFSAAPPRTACWNPASHGNDLALHLQTLGSLKCGAGANPWKSPVGLKRSTRNGGRRETFKGDNSSEGATSLQQQLEERIRAYEDQVETTRLLTQRLDEMDDMVQEEQADFDKQQNEWQETLRENSQRLESLTQQWHTTQLALEGLQGQQGKLEEMKQKREKRWKDAVATSSSISLKDTIDQRQQNVTTARNQLYAEQEGWNRQVQAEAMSVKALASNIQEEQHRFYQDRICWEKDLQQRQEDMLLIQKKLFQQQEEMKTNRTNLQSWMQEEMQRLAEYEADMKLDPSMQQSRIDEWKEKLTDEIQRGEWKEEQMQKRCHAIEREMGELWNATKRDAQIEYDRLHQHFQHVLDAAQRSADDLEQDVEEAMEEASTFSALVNQTTEDSHTLRANAELSAQVFVDQVAQQESTQANLQKQLLEMQSNTTQQDFVLRTHELQLESYKTSLRRSNSLLLALVRNKVLSAWRRLRRLMRL